MEWYCRVVLLSIMMMFGIGKNADAVEVAESLQYPFSDGGQTQYDSFGLSQNFNVWNSSWGGYHLGHDVNAPTGTKIYASADGVVIESQNHPHGGYGSACGAKGYIVLIESQLSDGTVFTVIYGHVRGDVYNEAATTGLVPEGTIVHRGQYIATVADYPGDSDYDGICGDANWDHLHFGIRIESYNSTESIRGYGSSVGSWTNPRDFITAHLFPSRTLRKLSNKAARLQQIDRIGANHSEPHWYNDDPSTFVVQDWYDGAWGWTALTFNPNATHAQRHAYAIHQGFWEYYRNHGNVGTFGAPLGDEIGRTSDGVNVDRDCQRHYHSTTECIAKWCGNATTYSSVQRFTNATFCWNEPLQQVDIFTTRSLSGSSSIMDDPVITAPVGLSDTSMSHFLSSTGLTGLTYEAFNEGYPSGQLIPSGAIYPGFVLALYGGAWMQYSWGDYACIMGNSTDYTSVSLRFNALVTTVAPVTYNLEQPATACGYNDADLVQCFTLTPDNNTVTFQGLQFPQPIDQLIITSSVTDDNFCFDTIWLEPDVDQDGLGTTIDADDLVVNWTGPEQQYLFIDTDQDGRADPCVRRHDAILCDENHNGQHDYAFRYGDGVSATYFSTVTGVAVVFNYGTFYLDDDADGLTDYTMNFGVSADTGHYIGNQGAVAIQRNTRYFVIDVNSDGAEDWFYPFGWGTATQHYYLADLDGDGVIDLLFREGNLFTVDINQDGSDDGYFTYGKGDSDDYYFADWDGDGCSDVIVRRGNSLFILDAQQITYGATAANYHTWFMTYGHGLE